VAEWPSGLVILGQEGLRRDRRRDSQPERSDDGMAIGFAQVSVGVVEHAVAQTGFMRTVSTEDELVAAVAEAERIVVQGAIAMGQSVQLVPGQRLAGSGDDAALVFAAEMDGVRVGRDNEVVGLRIQVDPDRRAVFNDTTVDDLGTIQLAAVTGIGQVQILARDRVRGGHVVVDGLDIVAADVRDRVERPALLGVGALQGAFTLWNQQPDSEVVVTAELRGLAAGRAGAPVRGSGVFVAGAVPDGSGGRLDVSMLQTGPVFTDGGIAEGSHELISGGVFVIYGAHVREVINNGPVTTFGVNDMVLDNWGVVDDWTARAPLTSYGPSGVGFVNFGTVTTLRIQAPVETHGIGARGFNVYRLDGFVGPTADTVEFDQITTHADAAIGIQIGQPIGQLIVHNGIHTEGGAGDSLVRGVITRLSAHALSIQPGGRVETVQVGGSMDSTGTGVAAVDVRGEIGTMQVAGGIHAAGADADALRLEGGTLRLRDTEVTSSKGAAIRLTANAGIQLSGVHANGANADVVVER
jgi:hypothetical protein